MKKLKIYKNDVVYFDMDGVLVELGNSKEEWEAVKKKPEFFLNKKPLKGANEVFRLFSNHCNTYLLSTPVWSNPECWKEKRLWVEKHLGEFASKKLILTHNKGLNDGKLLIDDSLKHGVSEFKGIHFHFGSPKYPTWNEVINSVEFINSLAPNAKI